MYTENTQAQVAGDLAPEHVRRTNQAKVKRFVIYDRFAFEQRTWKLAYVPHDDNSLNIELS